MHLEYINVLYLFNRCGKKEPDLIGYYNEFTRKFNETTLFQKLYEANYNDQIY